MLAAEAFRVSEKMLFNPDCRISVASETIDVGLRKSPDAELADAEEIVQGISGTPTREQVLARERILASKMPKTMEAEIQVLSIDDLAIVALPGEIFVEIGLEIKNASPFKYTFVVELGNGWLGYIPTAKAFSEGIETSYETWLARSSKCVPGTGGQMQAVALKLLNHVYGK